MVDFTLVDMWYWMMMCFHIAPKKNTITNVQTHSPWLSSQSNLLISNQHLKHNLPPLWMWHKQNHVRTQNQLVLNKLDLSTTKQLHHLAMKLKTIKISNKWLRILTDPLLALQVIYIPRSHILRMALLDQKSMWKIPLIFKNLTPCRSYDFSIVMLSHEWRKEKFYKHPLYLGCRFTLCLLL